MTTIQYQDCSTLFLLLCGMLATVALSSAFGPDGSRVPPLPKYHPIQSPPQSSTGALQGWTSAVCSKISRLGHRHRILSRVDSHRVTNTPAPPD